jgi:ribonuclease H2 subunit B
VLDTHLAALQEADAAAIAAVEPSAAKPGKKSKSATAAAADGGKKRKTAASHGVEQLKKANTTGMKKISSFFGGKE